MKRKTYLLQSLISIDDFAKEKNVTKQTVYNWIKDKKVVTIELYGKNLIDRTSYNK